ncbi:hypothetical protein PPACK8108_LOCUS25134 [Phakopsora pachyrhizi]|uniref:Chromatin modification-related protein EAF6 n=1 Tax=Phakopsora pachyrhizi TaxID=170000 RepID=A0AAV0BRA5_PHAPC|nr:hypothetical protein PPACK8108_LOCUS25134 [Phakopsora pachyrhizi]
MSNENLMDDDLNCEESNIKPSSATTRQQMQDSTIIIVINQQYHIDCNRIELAALETTLYAHETAYLTDPLAKSFGNIVKGYETTIVRKDIKRRDIRENLERKKVILDQSNLDCVCTTSHPTVAGHGKFQKRAPAIIDNFSNLFQALEYGWWFVKGDLSHLKLSTEQVKFLGLPIEIWVWLTVAGYGAQTQTKAVCCASLRSVGLGSILVSLMTGILTVNAPRGHISFFEAHGGHESNSTCCAAAEDRASLCEPFDGLWKPGGQG